MFRDNHHILFDRVSWSSRPESKSLRESKSLIVRLDRSEHNEVHKFCTPIPLLGYHALIRTLKYFEPQDTPLKSVENLMGSIELARNHPKAHPIEKELGNLAIWALDLERPFIAGKIYE